MKDDVSSDGVLGTITAGGCAGDLATETVSDEKDKLEGVETSDCRDSEGGSVGTGVIEGKGEAATSEVKGDGEGGIVLSLSNDETDEALEALGRKNDVS